MNLRTALKRTEPVVDVESGIAEELARSPPQRLQSYEDYAPPMLRLPHYVEHREGTPEIGKLSAEGIVREFESAAAAIDAMGVELIARVEQCEKMTAKAMLVGDEMKATAARYREEAKKIFNEIEQCSVKTEEVRSLCAELTAKITKPSS